VEAKVVFTHARGETRTTGMFFARRAPLVSRVGYRWHVTACRFFADKAEAVFNEKSGGGNMSFIHRVDMTTCERPIVAIPSSLSLSGIDHKFDARVAAQRLRIGTGLAASMIRWAWAGSMPGSFGRATKNATKL
jgi:hypothetical protein